MQDDPNSKDPNRFMILIDYLEIEIQKALAEWEAADELLEDVAPMNEMQVRLARTTAMKKVIKLAKKLEEVGEPLGSTPSLIVANRLGEQVFSGTARELEEWIASNST